MVALVDDEDFDRCNAFKWYASLESRGTKYYAKRHTRIIERAKWTAKSVRLHHFILDVVPSAMGADLVVDHVNHDGLDNRRCNLEIVTQTENMKRSLGWKKKIEEPCL